jgi:drug/metabolite transporter (DMT)-like permease
MGGTSNNNTNKDHNKNHNNSAAMPKSTGMFEYGIFLAALISGTGCSICSKTMMQMSSTGKSGHVEPFSKPIFQTLGMFVGMTFGLVMHAVVKHYRIEFPGYTHPPPATTTVQKNSNSGSRTVSYGSIPTTAVIQTRNEVPYWMLLFLAIPSIFDLAATALCMMGLQYLNVSIYQLLRGSGIIFVALLKQYWLDHPLYTFQWVGVSYNVVSVFLVSATAVLGNQQQTQTSVNDVEGSTSAVVGVGLVLAGALVQALQFVFEEKVMTMDESAAPPLLLIGMEGLWGTVLCLFVVYPLTTYVIPGNDFGGVYEDMGNTFTLIANSSTIQWAFCFYFLIIFSYNLFAVLVTFCLNSIWHAILDNFRPLTVWSVGVSMYYLGRSANFGEPWTIYSWIQVLGMVVLLYGTAIYNAPNPGSVKLTGQWWNFGINFTQEYEDLEEATHWESKKINQRRASSMAEMSPFIMQRTMQHRHQALLLLQQPSVVMVVMEESTSSFIA